MSTRRMLGNSGLVAVCIAILAGGTSSRGQTKCIGPQILEDAIHAHPGALTYVQLGRWFGQRH